MADMVVVMAQGRVEQAATARDIYVAPRNTYEARFVGGQNVLCGTVDSVMNGTAALAAENGVRFAFPGGESRPPKGSRLFGAVRRDRVALGKLAPGAKSSGTLNTAVDEVHTLENQGSYVKGTLDMFDAEEFVAHVGDEESFRDPFDIGDGVIARWSVSDVVLLDDGIVPGAGDAADPAVAVAG